MSESLFIDSQIAPPLPSSTREIQRVNHSRLRRRILYGYHEADVMGRVKDAVGVTRQQKWGVPDLTSNPLVSTYSQLAGLHKRMPLVTPPDMGGNDVLAAVTEAGLWSLMPRLGRDTLAMREGLLRVDVRQGADGAPGTPHFRPVFADLVEVETDPWVPDQPVRVMEWIPDPDDRAKWVQIITDVRSLEYRAVDQQGVDVSGRVLGGDMSGESYPFMGRTTARPRMPYIGYHAAQTGDFWDPFTGREVVEGVLQVCVLYTFYQHVVRNAAWMQRYIFGAQPQGLAESADGARSHEIVTDPATALLLEPLEGMEGGQPLIGQFGQPIDAEKLLNSIILYERRIIANAAGAPDVTRAEADVRSGYSLAVSHAAQREAQRVFEPMFRRSDLLTLSTTADLMGATVDGWRIGYRSLDPSPQEQAAEVDRIVKLVENGLMSRAVAYQRLNPELTSEEAAQWVADNPLPALARPAVG